jgi:hypothetical protein
MRFAFILPFLLAAPTFADEEQQQPPPAPAPDLAKTIDELKQRIDRQDQEIERMRRDLDETRARAESNALFRLGRFSVSMFGFVQADGVLYNQASVDELNPSTGQPENETRFLIRRGRLRVEGDYGIASGLLEFDGNTVNGATARVTAAEISLKWRAPAKDAPPYLQGSIGLLRIPFGYEVIEKDFERLFLERSNIIRALFPGEYDLGVRLSGGWRFLRYAVAAMNGNPSGDKQFAARDPSQSKDFVGRLGVDTHPTRRLALQGGISALYGTGFHAGTPSTKDTIVWRDLNNDGQVDSTELEAVLGQPATPSQTFSRYAIGADLRFLIAVPRLGELAIYGELVWAANLDRALQPADPVATGRDLRELGWYLAFTQQLTKWAAVGVRYDRYDPDQDAVDRQGAKLVPRDSTYSTLAVAIAGGYPPYVRVTLEYDHNTNALGRSASGAPATLGSDVLTLRGQVTF